MRPNQTRRPTPPAATASLIVLTGCLMLATPSLAQQRVSNPADGRTPGMRYLTWPGKNEAPRASRAVPTPSAPPEYRVETVPETRDDEPRGPILSMPSQPLVGPVATRYSARTSPGPTPASAWISNGGVPTSVAPAYDPTPTSAFVPAPPLESSAGARYAAPSYAPPSYAPRVATLPEPPRGYAPVVPLDAPPPRAERLVEAPAYMAPIYEERPVQPPRSEPLRSEPPRYERPVAADTGPAAEAPRPAPERMADQPAPAPVVVDAPPAEAPASTPAVDPYAPRADAPIFRLLNRGGQPAAGLDQAAPTPDGPPPPAAPTAPPRPQQTAQAAPAPAPYPAAAPDVDRSPRRYSVHRANGQSPDRVPLPDPVMLDSTPVDLAEPPETPTVVRNVNGRLTAITPSSQDPAQP